MRAVVMRETGGPEVLREEEVARPEPGDGEVLIRVRAASVNPIDWKYRRGLVEQPLPAVLGNDVSGTVEALARRAASPRATTCSASRASGGYAEFATAPGAAIAQEARRR